MKKPKYVLTFGVPGGSCSTIIFNSAAKAAEVACAILWARVYGRFGVLV